MIKEIEMTSPLAREINSKINDVWSKIMRVKSWETDKHLLKDAYESIISEIEGDLTQAKELLKKL